MEMVVIRYIIHIRDGQNRIRDEWWSAVCSAIGDVLKKGDIKPEEIKGIGVDGQSWSAIPIDKDGNVLTNTPIWMDTRAQSICDRLNVEIGAR